MFPCPCSVICDDGEGCVVASWNGYLTGVVYCSCCYPYPLFRVPVSFLDVSDDLGIVDSYDHGFCCLSYFPCNFGDFLNV